MFIFPFNLAQETVRRTRSKSSDYMYFDKNTTSRLTNLLGPKLDIFPLPLPRKKIGLLLEE